MTVCSIAAPIAVSLTRGQLFLTIPVIVVGYMIVGFSFGISLVTKAVAMALAVDEDQVWAANKSENSKFKFNSRELELTNLLGLVLGCIADIFRRASETKIFAFSRYIVSPHSLDHGCIIL